MNARHKPDADQIGVPGGRWRHFLLAVGLTALLLGFFLRVNSVYLFHTKLYESGDFGANSLSVLRSARFHELYGAYSRWEFHHPGPALFYSFALAEWLLYRATGLVPTPYNAQVIMALVLTCSFFAAGVSVAARWVRSGLFVPLALLLGVLHFTAVHTTMCASSTWDPYLLVFPFFALVMAGASVAAGQGDDLPLLVLADGFVVHFHVAQPIFVGPIALLAYAGLAWSCRHRPGRIPRPESQGDLVDAAAPSARPWRRFPCAHGFAAGLAAVFVLPMIVDLCFGATSNYAHILRHLHEYRGQHQPWLDSVYCLARFAVYKPSFPHAESAVSPSHVTLAEFGHFLLRHSEMTLLWLGALAAPFLALMLRRRGLNAGESEPDASACGQRWRFLGWLTIFLALGAGLTVYWGHIQDGKMYYFNSWFTYAIYYVLALLAAGAVCDVAETLGRRQRRRGLWTGLAAAGCGFATVGFVSGRLDQYREHDFDDDSYREAAHAVDAALAAHPAAPRTKLLLFPHDGWGGCDGRRRAVDPRGIPLPRVARVVIHVQQGARCEGHGVYPHAGCCRRTQGRNLAHRPV